MEYLTVAKYEQIMTTLVQGTGCSPKSKESTVDQPGMLVSRIGRCIPHTSNISKSAITPVRSLSSCERYPCAPSSSCLVSGRAGTPTSTLEGVTQLRRFSSTPAFRVDKNSLPIPPRLYSLEKPGDTQEARNWVARWKALQPEDDIPRSIVEVTFARSTGPGGQNVNKVSTKASMRLSLDSNAWWIPQWAIPFIESDTHYVASSNSLLITSHLTRSQSENLNDCFRKLHSVILDAASKPIKNEPTAAQKKRVEGFERAEKARRRQEKSYRSEVKKFRGSKGVSFD